MSLEVLGAGTYHELSAEVREALCYLRACTDTELLEAEERRADLQRAAQALQDAMARETQKLEAQRAQHNNCLRMLRLHLCCALQQRRRAARITRSLLLLVRFVGE
ncbi:hypothetical protein EON64_11790, partial [archaeon]